MKLKNSLWLLMVLAATAWAETPAEVELLSAQKAYQSALSNQNATRTKASQLQTQLETAQLQLKHYKRWALVWMRHGRQYIITSNFIK